MRNYFNASRAAITALIVLVLVAFSAVPGQAVDLKANFRLFGEVQGFGLGGWGDMDIHFGINGAVERIGRLEKPVGQPLIGYGVLDPLVVQDRVIDKRFSVPFSLEADQPASMYIGFGDNGMAGFSGGSVQFIFDFSDFIYFYPTTLYGACDQGLSLQSITMADGRTLEEAGFKFDFNYGNIVLVTGASAFDAGGTMPATNTATPPDRSAIFMVKANAVAKMQGGADGFCGPTESLVDLDVNPEPDPYVFDMAFAALTGTNNIMLTRLSPPANTPPTVDAGANLNVRTEEMCAASVIGTANDSDGDVLKYRWLEGTNQLTEWTVLVPETQPRLDICSVVWSPGQHTLTLEVTDGKETVSDNTILTLQNTAPHAVPSSSGATYQIGAPILLGGQASDYDNDTLSYRWSEGEREYCAGSVVAPEGSIPGMPVALPDCTLPSLGLGHHEVVLAVSDGVNTPVKATVAIDIVDTTMPTLAPKPDKSILWPPNHKMVTVTIDAHAWDNGGTCMLGAAITSNEAVEGLGDGDTAPDWSDPVIDQQSGTITFALRAERSGRGTGREYTVAVTATDLSGNRTTVPVVIIVPHDLGNK